MKRPYAPPELRKLELEQLTAEQRAWVEEERARLAQEGREKQPGSAMPILPSQKRELAAQRAPDEVSRG